MSARGPPPLLGSVVGDLFVGYFVVYIVHALGRFRIPDMGAVFVQGGSHCAVALALGVNVPQRYRKQQRVVQHIGYVQVAVAVGYHKQVVALVVILVAILHHYMVGGVYLMVKRVETAVARYLHHPLAVERAVIHISLLYQIKVYVHVGEVDLSVLHVLEKLRVYMEILFVMTICQRGELYLILCEFSHTYTGAPKEGHRKITAKLAKNLSLAKGLGLKLLNFHSLLPIIKVPFLSGLVGC